MCYVHQFLPFEAIIKASDNDGLVNNILFIRIVISICYYVSKETCEKCWILKYFRYYPFSVFAWVEGRPGREAVSLAGVSFDHKEIQGEVVLALLHVL